MSRPGGKPFTGSVRAGLPGAVQWILLLALVVLLAGSVAEFYNIAAGTGTWYGDISLRWFGALTLFTFGCLGLLLAASVPRWRTLCRPLLIALRSRLGGSRIVAAVLSAGLPLALLQYTPWGAVIRGPYLRSLVWGLCVVSLAWLMCRERASLLTIRSLVGALLLTGSVLVIGATFTYVTDYPFSLGWSEGNRLWDYSLIFGKSRYDLAPGVTPVAYLDIGRQIIGGLPFIFPKVSIAAARAWLAIVATVPYLVVGMLAFLPKDTSMARPWLLPSLFALIFLSQGPIHAPLVVCVILVLLAWRLPIGWAVAILAIAGYVAATSRFTWVFAPAMWIVMLEIGAAAAQDDRNGPQVWRRALALGSAGLLGSAAALSGIFRGVGTSQASSVAVSASQALLWYRLLPNATYGDGILLGLIKAAGPLVLAIVLAWIIYGSRSRLSMFIMAGTLLAFLVVGLVVSTKIGGGGDLHNLDMFLVGLLLAAAILWHSAGESWLKGGGARLAWLRAAVVLSLVVPGFGALMSLQPLEFTAESEWIRVLVGVERTRDLGSLPDEATTAASLEQLRAAVADAKGPVLFMDQRQLLTFGYVRGVELHPEFEKKRLMDEALSGNAQYFGDFYRDLADGRFSLIISSPLRTPIKDSDYGFGEENNAWVKWVAKPVLCYYQELDTLNAVKVELLVPRQARANCDTLLPGGQQ